MDCGKVSQNRISHTHRVSQETGYWPPCIDNVSNISHGSVVTHSRHGGIFTDNFIAESDSEKVLKISPNVAKIGVT